MIRHGAMFLAIATLGLAVLPSYPVHAQTADLGCTMKFSLNQWSVIYKHAQGKGVITCKNGATKDVVISAVGAGATVGKFQIDNGTGKFTHVRTIDDVVGSYVAGQADLGIVKSGTVQLLTKGTVSLALAGAGEGINLGVDLSRFTIKAAK